jgi:hypothetical protein
MCGNSSIYELSDDTLSGIKLVFVTLEEDYIKDNYLYPMYFVWISHSSPIINCHGIVLELLGS